MIGGDPDAVAQVEPVFAVLAPGVGAADRTPGRDGAVSTAENGYLHCGPNGAGHVVKMVHNGIEYGSMASIAEGLNIDSRRRACARLRHRRRPRSLTTRQGSRRTRALEREPCLLVIDE